MYTKAVGKQLSKIWYEINKDGKIRIASGNFAERADLLHMLLCSLSLVNRNQFWG